ncbi:AAEL009606-PA, partial [Aedes aegypti]
MPFSFTFQDCRGSFPIVKCTYCRTEFQQTSKGSTAAICKKCDQNVKQYGKPSACDLCNIIAAFIGSKCQRCTNSELKYGPAVTCDQCKQRCAFNRPDYKVDGKLLCWLCTLSYKRALTKARQAESDRRRAKKRGAEGGPPPALSSSASGADNRSTSDKTNSSSNSSSMNRGGGSSLPPLGDVSLGPSSHHHHHHHHSKYVDPHSSDHVIAMTQLKETIATLQRKIKQKDGIILEKEKEISAWKGKHLYLEQDLMKKYKDMEKNYEFKLEVLNKKLKSQLLEIAQLPRDSDKEDEKDDENDKKDKKESESDKEKDDEQSKSNGSVKGGEDSDKENDEKKDDQKETEKDEDKESDEKDRSSDKGSRQNSE